MNNGHKVGLESKIKFNFKELNGGVSECKIKNNGELVAEMKSDYLKVSKLKLKIILNLFFYLRSNSKDLMVCN